MKQVVIICCVALLLFSCQKDLDKPNPFIEQSKMEDILYDVALLYGMQTTNAFVSDTVKAVQIKDIFDKYQIDSLTFTANNRYYVKLKKGVYFDMQTRVMNRLKKDKEGMDSLLSKKELELAPVAAIAVDSMPVLKADTNQVKPIKNTELIPKTKKVKQTSIKEVSPEMKKKLVE
ncbi:DUF4296 domain-containing protein [Myroides odoratus]|uniref:DUF4296 domain-containing protein n=1 Tax=Myroides odoratus TaxID=256 RepID=A0A9Q6Z5C6_MYROD|nr:DUF4296 domain-containing protein [Myroides odoratus]EHQ42206.1 hypothetical protein Myrod_1373 [Myroides odoratus DSM 2801]EKB09300.1 hypothetical protein HMPREF9716_00120 [Myroides odoratus CIP 103059]QQT99586.1 DUF4296 domain-containing protein [Myroides odoratus]WQD58207.1 DUF4296 domain-containing protein [Myroides odoratus]STZ29466.1 Uncharacterised protein [Myroides odoratus]